MGLIDITGQRFGKLVALEYVGKERWRTICDCGNEYVVYERSLRNGLTTHCGCSKSKRLGKPKQDLTGQKYGRLTFVSYAGKSKWVVRCDCGTIKTMKSYDVLKGLVISCGCYHHEIMKGRVPVNRTHGLAHTPIFNIWAMMKNRCTNPNCNRHQYYKDKGIKVCDRWLGEDGIKKHATKEDIESILAEVEVLPLAPIMSKVVEHKPLSEETVQELLDKIQALDTSFAPLVQTLAEITEKLKKYK